MIGSSGGDVLIADNGISRITGGTRVQTSSTPVLAPTPSSSLALRRYEQYPRGCWYDAIYGFEAGIDKVDLSAPHSDAGHLLIQTNGTSNSIYLEATPGTFNPSTDLLRDGHQYEPLRALCRLRTSFS